MTNINYNAIIVNIINKDLRGVMKQVSMPVKFENKVFVKANADVVVDSTNENIMRVLVSQSDALKISENGDKLEIKADSDLHLFIPTYLTLTLEKVAGDCMVSGISTRVVIGKVAGDLALQRIGGASIDTVAGDLSLREISGGVEVSSVGGDLVGEDLDTLFSRKVGGDTFLKNIADTLNVLTGGDVDVHITSMVAPKASIKSGGDTLLTIPKELNAQLQLHSKSGTIGVHIDGRDEEYKAEASIHFGADGNVIEVHADGDISVAEIDKNLEINTQRWTDSFGDLENLSLRLDQELRKNAAFVTDQIQWASFGAAKAGENARRKVEKSLRKLKKDDLLINFDGFNKPGDSRGSNSNNQIASGGKFVGFDYPGEQKNPAPAQNEISNEERLMVLKMLQENKITIEEAETLFAALGN